MNKNLLNDNAIRNAIETDAYAKKYVSQIKTAILSGNKMCLINTINKIYEDGFQDGHNENIINETTQK